MKLMKRFATAALAFLFLTALFLGGAAQAGAAEDGKISVVSTTFPQYDWVRQILGEYADNFELALLLDNRVDLHSYQPSVDDIVRISTCDLFIYVGGQSDGWVESALRQATNPDMIVINLMDLLGDDVKAEEIIEGMEHDDDHGHGDEHGDGHDDDHDDDDHHECELDEHVWLSLKNAEIFCSAIAEALSSLNAGDAEEYRGNLAAYLEKLSALDAEYRAAASGASVKTLLFGDRFPFRYLSDDYGLSYHAAFPGCSAETEASFHTIVFLAGKVDELSLKNVMVTESANQSIAQTIINNTRSKDQQILVLDSMQSVTANDIQDGASYLSIMEGNLLVLKEALM